MKTKIVLAIAIVVVVIVALGLFFVLRAQKGGEGNSIVSSLKDVVSSDNGSDYPIKHLGIELAPYDAATQTAGDIKFTSIPLQFDRLYFDYGFRVPANSVGPAKDNPQPTFIVPLGTKVHAIVDGEVVSVPKLYSNDYSIHVSPKGSDLVFETEHVINPLVKVGDTVKAGDVIAEVSDYDSRNTPGFGLVEIGILKGGNPPKHVCPFLYLDPTFKEEVNANLHGFYQAWNAYKGKTIYDESSLELPGCVSTEEIEG